MIDTVVGSQPLVVLTVHADVIDVVALTQCALALDRASDKGTDSTWLLGRDARGVEHEHALGVAHPDVALVVLLHLVDIGPIDLTVVLVDEGADLIQAVGARSGIDLAVIPAEDVSLAIGRDITVAVDLHIILASHQETGALHRVGRGHGEQSAGLIPVALGCRSLSKLVGREHNHGGRRITIGTHDPQVAVVVKGGRGLVVADLGVGTGVVGLHHVIGHLVETLGPAGADIGRRIQRAELEGVAGTG